MSADDDSITALIAKIKDGDTKARLANLPLLHKALKEGEGYCWLLVGLLSSETPCTTTPSLPLAYSHPHTHPHTPTRSHIPAEPPKAASFTSKVSYQIPTVLTTTLQDNNSTVVTRTLECISAMLSSHNRECPIDGSKVRRSDYKEAGSAINSFYT